MVLWPKRHAESAHKKNRPRPFDRSRGGFYCTQMGKHIHTMLSKDIEAKRGVCANCGDVRIRKKSNVWCCQKGLSPRRGGKKIWEYERKGSHGLTDSEAKSLKSGKSCQICRSETMLVVDHCHRKNFVRGVLCMKCNSGLGFFRDDPALLIKASEYLASGEGIEPSLAGLEAAALPLN